MRGTLSDVKAAMIAARDAQTDVTAAQAQTTPVTRALTTATGELAEGLTKTGRAARETVPALDQHRKAVQALQDQLTGSAALKSFQVWADALGSTSEVAKLATKDQDALRQIVDEVILRMGTAAPPAVKAYADALTAAQIVTQGIRADWQLTAQDLAQLGTKIEDFGPAWIGAFERMGIATRVELRRAAEAAQRDYEIIKASGLATAEELEKARARMVAAVAAATEQTRGFWGGLFEAVKGSILGDGQSGFAGLFGQVMPNILGSFEGAWGHVFQAGTAIARAFAGDFSAVTALVQQHFAKLVSFIGDGVKKIGSFFKSLFGGPSAQELGGREVAREFDRTVNSMFAAIKDRVEPATEQWQRNNILLREAYIALGMTAEQAIAETSRQLTRLWESEKHGADATRRVMDEILNVLAVLGGEGVEAFEAITGSAKDSFADITQLAKSTVADMQDAFNDLRFTVQGTIDMPDVPRYAATAATGGLVTAHGISTQYRALGGLIKSIFKPKGTDTQPTMLTVGEGVVNLRGMDLLGPEGLAALNTGVPALPRAMTGSPASGATGHQGPTELTAILQIAPGELARAMELGTPLVVKNILGNFKGQGTALNMRGAAVGAF